MTTRTRRWAAAGALALPLALLGCGGDDPEELVSGGVEEAEQFDQNLGPADGGEGDDDASEEGEEEPATAPQVGAED